MSAGSRSTTSVYAATESVAVWSTAAVCSTPPRSETTRAAARTRAASQAGAACSRSPAGASAMSSCARAKASASGSGTTPAQWAYAYPSGSAGRTGWASRAAARSWTYHARGRAFSKPRARAKSSPGPPVSTRAETDPRPSAVSSARTVSHSRVPVPRFLARGWTAKASMNAVWRLAASPKSTSVATPSKEPSAAGTAKWTVLVPAEGLRRRPALSVREGGGTLSGRSFRWAARRTACQWSTSASVGAAGRRVTVMRWTVRRVSGRRR
ncbi:hypothetical protein EAO77_11260 [Streptomyces sp. t39]|nr:hypothetical protein EAO77_11260 [Streptomyces sp. t39]